MNCVACGKTLSATTRFCGGCGRPVAGSVTASREDQQRAEASEAPAGSTPRRSSEVTPAAPLLQELDALAQVLREANVAAPLADAVEALRRLDATRGRIAIIGEKARGKTTLANLLLGHALLPTGRLGISAAVVVRAGPAWQRLASADDPRPITEPGAEFRLAEGPAPLLEHLDLVDTPGMNDADARFDDVVVTEVASADLVLICLSATQLLSETERAMIRLRVLPVASGEVGFVLTHLDGIETEEDRVDLERRLGRFVERLDGRVVAIFRVAGTALDALPGDLARFVEASGLRARRRGLDRWHTKVIKVLDAIFAVVERASDPVAPTAPRDDTAELLALVADENRLALGEARSMLRSHLAKLRSDLSTRLSPLGPEAVRGHGLASLIGEVQGVARQAAALYVDRLEEGLTRGVPTRVAVTAMGLREATTPQVAASMDVAAPTLHVEARRPPDQATAALTAIGALLVLSGGTALPLLGGATALVAAYQRRKGNEEAFRQRLREDARDALQEWMSEVEVDLVQQLEASAASLGTALGDRLRSLAPPRPTATRRTLDEVKGQLRRCVDACLDAASASPGE